MTDPDVETVRAACEMAGHDFEVKESLAALDRILARQADLLAALEATDKRLGPIYERTEDEGVHLLHLFVAARIAAAHQGES